MSAIGETEITVDASAIDVNGHVNNVRYVQWMQDAAMAHSASLGWSYDRYVELGATWIIRTHTIEYLHSSYLGDRLKVYTWVAHIQKFRSLRRFKFYRPSDDTLIARAETLFIFCDLQSGRPRSIPPEVQQAYTVVDEADEP